MWRQESLTCMSWKEESMKLSRREVLLGATAVSLIPTAPPRPYRPIETVTGRWNMHGQMNGRPRFIRVPNFNVCISYYTLSSGKFENTEQELFRKKT